MTKPQPIRLTNPNFVGVSTSLEYGLLAVLMSFVITSAFSSIGPKFTEAITSLAANI